MSGKRRDYLSSYEVDANGCWNYTGSVNANGYGRILQTTAHRYFYLALAGSIPAGLQLDHLCMNKLCVNPEHLEPVTGAENMRRRSEAQTHCDRGHEFTPENTYRRKNRNSRECVTCRYDRWASKLGRPVGHVGRPSVAERTERLAS